MPVVPKPKNYCRCGCGTEIKATRKYVSGHNLKRRPKDAVVKNGRSYLKIKCTECGSKFEKRADQINRRSMVNLCSKDCISAYQSRNRKGKTIPNARTGQYRCCKHCKEEFYINNRRANKDNNGKFCSKECYYEWVRETGFIPNNFINSPNNSGKNNGRYKHGNRVGSHTNKKKVREKVIERDGGNWCLLCGKPGPGLHLHRIVYGSQNGNYEVDNCVQLCAECHALVHSSKKRWMPRLQKHIEKKKELAL